MSSSPGPRVPHPPYQPPQFYECLHLRGSQIFHCGVIWNSNVLCPLLTASGPNGGRHACRPGQGRLGVWWEGCERAHPFLTTQTNATPLPTVPELLGISCHRVRHAVTNTSKKLGQGVKFRYQHHLFLRLNFQFDLFLLKCLIH